ncbi:hypothetical protein [Cryptosporangium sp. NPDC051539]|uniref:hypothetical protein n=1 Tax=Cryptosporangium sp. NPDC051539 TaxID=3363962 RepID=UPI0037A94093
MYKVTVLADAGPKARRIVEVGTAATIAIVHDVTGWLLIAFAILIIAVAGPRKRSLVFAVLFAAAIVLVVTTSWSNRAADSALPSTTTGNSAHIVPWLASEAVVTFAASVADNTSRAHTFLVRPRR